MRSNSTAGFGDAVAAARRADATVILVGLDLSVEAEGHDRHDITLPGESVCAYIYIYICACVRACVRAYIYIWADV